MVTVGDDASGAQSIDWSQLGNPRLTGLSAPQSGTRLPCAPERSMVWNRFQNPRRRVRTMRTSHSRREGANDGRDLRRRSPRRRVEVDGQPGADAAAATSRRRRGHGSREAAASLGYVPSTQRRRAWSPAAPATSASSCPTLQPLVLRRGARGDPGRAAGARTRPHALRREPGHRGPRGGSSSDFLARKRFDGLIAVGLEPEDHELERLLTIGRPVVSVVGDPARSPTVIGIDDDDAARRATEHLIALGHRQIAFVGGGGPTRWAQRRPQAAETATSRRCRDAGLADMRRTCPPTSPCPAAMRPRSTCSATARAGRRRSSRCATRWRSARSSRRAGSASRCRATSASSASTITSTPRCSP